MIDQTRLAVRRAYQEQHLPPRELTDDNGRLIEKELGWPKGTIAAITSGPILELLTGLELALVSYARQMTSLEQVALLQLVAMTLQPKRDAGDLWDAMNSVATGTVIESAPDLRLVAHKGKRSRAAKTASSEPPMRWP